VAKQKTPLPAARDRIADSLPAASVDRQVTAPKASGQGTPGGLYREDDLPGYLIPQLSAGYLRYGETRGVRGIVEHNRVDLLSLVVLVGVLARVCTPSRATAMPTLGDRTSPSPQRRLKRKCELVEVGVELVRLNCVLCGAKWIALI
jgi:hypothetical protein